MKIPKAASLLLALAIPLAITVPTAALAATQPITEGVTLPIGSADGSQAEVASERLAYSLGEGDDTFTSVDITPITPLYAFVTAGHTPAFIVQSETNTRTFTFTNAGAVPFTVKDIAAEIVEVDYQGSASTHQIVPAGTSVLAAPQADVIVPAKGSVPVTFDTTDPYAAVIRTNANGEITGVGSTTAFTFTVDGEEYGFQEQTGLGSANIALEREGAEEALFPNCDSPSAGLPSISLCLRIEAASVSMTAIYNATQPTTPVGDASITGRVITSAGIPVPDVTVVLYASTPSTQVTDSDGRYTFTDLPAGSYKVGLNIEGGSGYKIISTPRPFTLTSLPVILENSVIDTGEASAAPAITAPSPAASTLAAICQNPALALAASFIIGVLIFTIAVLLTIAFFLRRSNEKRENNPLPATTLRAGMFEQMQRELGNDRHVEDLVQVAPPTYTPPFPIAFPTKHLKAENS